MAVHEFSIIYYRGTACRHRPLVRSKPSNQNRDAMKRSVLHGNTSSWYNPANILRGSDVKDIPTHTPSYVLLQSAFLEDPTKWTGGCIIPGPLFPHHVITWANTVLWLSKYVQLISQLQARLRTKTGKNKRDRASFCKAMRNTEVNEKLNSVAEIIYQTVSVTSRALKHPSALGHARWNGQESTSNFTAIKTI